MTGPAVEQVVQGPMLGWSTPERDRRFNRFCKQYLSFPHGFGAGTPFVVSKEQRRWVKSVDNARITVVMVARGNGKSTFGAAMALWTLVDPYPGDLAPEIVVVSN